MRPGTSDSVLRPSTAGSEFDKSGFGPPQRRGAVSNSAIWNKEKGEIGAAVCVVNYMCSKHI